MADQMTIGKYQVQGTLKRGGMGTLYLGYDPELERQVAIKVLRDDIEMDQLRERFAREAKAVARLRHPNIVTIFDFGIHETLQYIVMEYIPGKTLAEVIRRELSTPLATKLQLIDGLSAGLAFAHKANVVHRDVKPANLMVDVDGTLKILDFGIAQIAGPALTRAGDIIGTVNYMSPEQLTGGRVDHRSDIFAVGAVLYELITGVQAFGGDLCGSVVSKILYAHPAPMTTLCTDIDPQLCSIVARALAKEPDQRYPDLRPFQDDLSEVRDRLRNAATEVRSHVVPVRPTHPEVSEQPASGTPTLRIESPRQKDFAPTKARLELVAATVLLATMSLGVRTPSLADEGHEAAVLAASPLPQAWIESPMPPLTRRPSIALSTQEPVASVTNRTAQVLRPTALRVAPIVSRERPMPTESRKEPAAAAPAADPSPGSGRLPTVPDITVSRRPFEPHLPSARAADVGTTSLEAAAPAEPPPTPVARKVSEASPERLIRQSLDEYLSAMSSLSIERVGKVFRLNDVEAESLKKSLATTRALKIELMGEPMIRLREGNATASCTLRYRIQRSVGSPVTTDVKTTFSFNLVGERWMIDKVAQ